MYYIHYTNIICVCNTRRSYIVYVISPRITFTYIQGSLADFLRFWVDPESFSTKAYVKIFATKITYFDVSRQKCCISNVLWERGKRKRKKEKEENFVKTLSLIQWNPQENQWHFHFDWIIDASLTVVTLTFVSWTRFFVVLHSWSMFWYYQVMKPVFFAIDLAESYRKIHPPESCVFASKISPVETVL